MKKTLVLFALLALTLTLSGCITIPRYKYFDNISPDRVTSVQIYDLREDETAHYRSIPKDAPSYTVSEEEKEAFINALAEFPFDDSVIISCVAVDFSDWYQDFAIKINYKDDSYRFISATGYNEYYEKSGVRDHYNSWRCSKDDFMELIKPYLPEEIFEDTAE